MMRPLLPRGVIAMQFWSARRFVLAAFSVLAAGAALSAAEPPAQGEKDILDDARRREQVAQQKAEDDFRAALREMNKLENANPSRAAERLKRMLAVLEEDTTLRADKRAAWKRVLKDRIRIAEAGAERAAKDAADAAAGKAAKEDRRSIEEQKARDEDKLRRDLEDVRRMQRDGRTEEASRKAADLARLYPDNPSAVASKHITGMADRIKQAKLVKDLKEDRWTLAMLDIEKSAVLPKDPDYNFPPPDVWRDITKRRTKSENPATEREKAILKALESPVSVKFEVSTFESVIDYLQTLTGQTIVVDKATLDAAQITYDTPITVKVRRVSLRTLLHKVLGEVGLTYVVKNEVIQVVTPKQAAEMMTVRTYYLGDLAGVTDFQFGPAFTAAAMALNVTQLIQLIVGTIEPDSWQVNNPEAKGTIFFNPRTLTLVVKQSAEIHYMLGGIGGR
jgi:hypothetical protein